MAVQTQLNFEIVCVVSLLTLNNTRQPHNIMLSCVYRYMLCFSNYLHNNHYYVYICFTVNLAFVKIGFRCCYTGSA